MKKEKKGPYILGDTALHMTSQRWRKTKFQAKTWTCSLQFQIHRIMAYNLLKVELKFKLPTQTIEKHL